MKVLSKLTLVFIFGSVGLFAQAPDTAWTRTYGGADRDAGRMVQQTTDGGYIVSGWTRSFGAGDNDFYLIKTNASGDILWTKTYGTARDDRAGFIQQTTDGGYIVSGVSLPANDSLGDIYMIKINDQGDTLWSKRYAGANNHMGYPAVQTADGGYIISGSTYLYGAGGLDIYLIKTNSQGDTLWTRTYGGVNEEMGFVFPDVDGGYIVSGQTCSFGDTLGDVYLVKTDSLGIPVWTKTYGGTNSDAGFAGRTPDGGLIISGWTFSYGAGSSDVYLIKTNSQGDTLWTRTFGGTGADLRYDFDYSVHGGYIVSGQTCSFGDTLGDVYLVKTDSLGIPVWTKTVGGSDTDIGYSVQQTSDGGYIVAGTTSSYGAGGEDFYLIKIKPEGSGIEEEITTGLFSLSPADPNPFTTKTIVQYELPNPTNVNVSIYNMLGQKVRDLYSGKQSSGIHSVSWDGTGESGEKSSSGVYLLKIEGEGEEASTKVMFVR